MRRAILIGLCAVLSRAQSPTVATVPQLYVQSAIPGDAALKVQVVVLNPAQFSLLRDSGKLTLSLTPPPPAPKTIFVPGFITLTLPNGDMQVSADTSWLTYRSAVIPTGPGPCAIGTAGWSADTSGVYMCVPQAAVSADVPFVWGWISATGFRVSLPDPANPGVYIWGVK